MFANSSTVEPVGMRLRLKPALTREQFLARCATAFDLGLVTPETIPLLERWTDLGLRAGAVAAGCDSHQALMVRDTLQSEAARLGERCTADGFPMVLASDPVGYALVRFAAILDHPCQICAESPDAWHTRTAMCPHRDTAPGGEETRF